MLTVNHRGFTMKNALHTDAVSQSSHSYMHSRNDGLTHSRTEALSRSMVGGLNRSRDNTGYIAPRTLAKMRDESYLKLARQRFLSDLPFSTPSEAVEAGARSVTEWCLCLADAKSESGRGDYPNN